MNDQSDQQQKAGFGRVTDPSWLKTIRMTAGAVRNRLGRMTITWLGIALGISFLMSTIVSASLRRSLEEVRHRRAGIENMFGALRAEVGNLSGKKIVVVGTDDAQSTIALPAFLEYVRSRNPKLGIEGPLPLADAGNNPGVFGDASAIIAWRVDPDNREADWETWAAAMKQPVILTFGEPGSRPSVVSSRLRFRELLPPPTAEDEARLEKEQSGLRSRMRWLVGVSLLVAAIGISNALLMSVSERFREIGTMKCLGASNRFIIKLVLLESGFLGISGALFGMLLGVAFGLVGFGGTYGFGLVFSVLDVKSVLWGCLFSFMIGWVVAVLAAVYPAQVAARMVASDALRSEV